MKNLDTLHLFYSFYALSVKTQEKTDKVRVKRRFRDEDYYPYREYIMMILSMKYIDKFLFLYANSVSKDFIHTRI